MLLSQPFQSVTPTVDGDILALLARADQAFTPGEVHRLIGKHSLSGVRKSLARLADQGIVDAVRRGNATMYNLNRDHLAADAVIELSRSFERLLDRLRYALSQFIHPPVYAALFGSAARGDMRLDSDIDLFLVRPPLSEEDRTRWDIDVSALTQQVSRWTGNDARELDMSTDDVRAGLAAGDDPVLTSIREQGIVLSGSDRFWRCHAAQVPVHS